MAEQLLIEAVKRGDLQTVEALLSEGAEPNERDEHGWTALNWAAGRGDQEVVAVLLARGADLTLTGRDKRTPLMIAKAAGRREVVEILTQAEQKLGVWRDTRESRLFCKAYALGELRRFEAWAESGAAGLGDPGQSEPAASEALPDPQIVYVHQDFSVTKSMWHGQDVIFDDVTPAWRTFCETTLAFTIPEDLL
jgi:uncharacterized protein